MIEPGMRIAPMNVLYKFFSLDYFLDAVVRNNCRTIELWGGAPHIDIEEITSEEVGHLKKRITGRNLQVCSLTPETGLYPVNIASGDKLTSKRSEAYLMKALEVATEMGIPLMQVTSGSGYYNEPVDEAWGRSVDTLGRIVLRAEALGIELALEPLSRHESNLVYDTAALSRMLADIDSPVLGVQLDTAVAAAAGESPSDYFRLFGTRIKHIQLIDGPDGHLAWGDGSLPLAQYVAEACKHGYTGSFGLELFDHKYYVEPGQVLARSIEALRSLEVKGGDQA